VLRQPTTAGAGHTVADSLPESATVPPLLKLETHWSCRVLVQVPVRWP